MAPSKKLLLVDDHALLRESLVMLLQHRLPGLALCEAGSLQQALACLRAEPDIDLVLLDLELPDSRGAGTLAALREACPLVPVVVLSAHDQPDNVLAAIDQGAAGFLAKTVNAQALVAAVQRVVAGGVVVPADTLMAMSAMPAMPATTATPGAAAADAPGDLGELAFTERQRDVLRLLVAGLPDKLICRELALSHGTVKTHLQAVFRKLGVSSRTQAVLALARLGALT